MIDPIGMERRGTRPRPAPGTPRTVAGPSRPRAGTGAADPDPGRAYRSHHLREPAGEGRPSRGGQGFEVLRELDLKAFGRPAVVRERSVEGGRADSVVDRATVEGEVCREMPVRCVDGIVEDRGGADVHVDLRSRERTSSGPSVPILSHLSEVISMGDQSPLDIGGYDENIPGMTAYRSRDVSQMAKKLHCIFGKIPLRTLSVVRRAFCRRSGMQ